MLSQRIDVQKRGDEKMFFGSWRKKSFIESIVNRAIDANKHSKKTIVFPETDETIIKACDVISKRAIATPLILGNKDRLLTIFKRLKTKNLSTQNIIDYLDEKDEKLKSRLDEYAKTFIELRKEDGKAMNIDDAKKIMQQPHYYGAMLVHKGLADGMISGINSETKPYLPAFEIIKTKEGIEKASGLFVMENQKAGNTYGDANSKVLFFADCALNINPSSELLAGIALTTADTAINFGIKPKIAMLSFSTRDSAKHEMVDKVKNAVKLVKQKNPELIIDGEIQLDAAIIPDVAKKKCPGSVLEGQANVLIFPDLNSGNIGYKLTQRLAGYTAIGPIMQGLNKPVNDLSRGASIEDIVEMAAVTVLQGL